LCSSGDFVWPIGQPSTPARIALPLIVTMKIVPYLD
jgi:hypothetical protein